MKLRNYLTEKQVEAESTTLSGALEISIKHHEQNAELTQKQLNVLRSRNISVIGSGLCGLCYFYSDCPKCLLGKSDDVCAAADSAFGEVHAMYIMYKTYGRTEEYFSDFIKAELRMVAVLHSLRNKLSGQKEVE